MKIDTLIKLCRSGMMKKAILCDNQARKEYEISSVVYTKKGRRFYFNGADGKNVIHPVIRADRICLIERLPRDEKHEYVFRIIMTTDRDDIMLPREYYFIPIMEKHYTPFITDWEDLECIEAISESIPAALKGYENKPVRVFYYADSEIFNEYDVDTDYDEPPLVSCIYIQSFGYHSHQMFGVNVIDIYDTATLNDDNHSTVWMRLHNVSFMDDAYFYTDSGNYHIVLAEDEK